MAGDNNNKTNHSYNWLARDVNGSFETHVDLVYDVTDTDFITYRRGFSTLAC